MAETLTNGFVLFIIIVMLIVIITILIDTWRDW